MTERQWIARTSGDPLAGNDPGAKAVVAALDDAVGFDTVDIGGSAGGWTAASRRYRASGRNSTSG
jgi:predicted dinucleotide-binding enzyme